MVQSKHSNKNQRLVLATQGGGEDRDHRHSSQLTPSAAERTALWLECNMEREETAVPQPNFADKTIWTADKTI